MPAYVRLPNTGSVSIGYQGLFSDAQHAYAYLSSKDERGKKRNINRSITEEYPGDTHKEPMDLFYDADKGKKRITRSYDDLTRNG